MKKKFVSLLLVLCLVIMTVFTVYNESDAGTSSFNVTNTSQTLEVGKSLTLKVNGVKSKKVKWKSSNNNIATVSKTGTVKAVKEGTSTISGKYKGITFKTKITVNPKQTSKTTNILLCKDENIAVYLIGYGKSSIKLNIVNSSDKEYKFGLTYINFGGKTYYDEVFVTEIYPGLEKEYEIDDIILGDSSFTGGKLIGQFNYYITDEDCSVIFSKDIKFDVNVK